ncbi:hypothetical protein F53441_10930 [Fusarium austroafricanum]|uniref:Uncharacterized protein n=1 Tax=Fusarium austroafricanum TaxID=2364996 RepID=A0A8H4K7P3_9HYPO|nr:hypothetical protein F53441_10930 [Fusarium austroafricanum]
MAQTPYYSGNHPPPLFLAELDSQPGRPCDTPAHHGPDGTPVFEMSGEPVLAQQKQDGNQSSPSWPSPLQPPGVSQPAQQGEVKGRQSKYPSPVPQSAMANPWAYFGPESSDNKLQEIQPPLTDGRRPSEPAYKPYPGNSNTNPPEVPHGTRPSTNPSSPNLRGDDNTFYPAPLKLAHRPANTASPPAFKAYNPPASQDTSDFQPKPLCRPDSTSSHSPTASNAYRPYRPHSPQTSATPVPSSNTRPATTSPQSVPLASPPIVPQQQIPGTAPHHFHSTPPPAQVVNPPESGAGSPKPASDPSTTPRPHVQQPQPQPQYGIPNAAPAQPVPTSASTYPPSPMTPLGHLVSAVAPSPATPAINVGGPFTQPQYAANVTVPNYAQTPTPGVTTSSPAAPAAPSHNTGVPFTQPQYAAPVQAHSYGPNQPTAAPSQAPTPVVPSLPYSSPQQTPAQSGYSLPQPNYAPAPTPAPVCPTLDGSNQQSHNSPAPCQQATPAGAEIHQSHNQQSNTTPYGMPAPATIPQSPPPPYAPQDTSAGAGSQPPAPGNPMVYQPSSVGPYPPQPQYPTQPSYAPTMSPPLQGHSTNGLQPPALPPRPSSSQGFAPTSGFGAGPASYDPANYPRPPQTYFAPPPALPPRPGLGKLSGGGGKLFGSSSADKWLRKTGQVLESTLAPYLQGQPSSYRPGLQGHQGQPMQQAQGPYPPQGHNLHAPHLAPQFRGAPEPGQPPQGPSAPGH